MISREDPYREHSYRHGLRHLPRKSDGETQREAAARRNYYRSYSQRLASASAVMRDPAKSPA